MNASRSFRFRDSTGRWLALLTLACLPLAAGCATHSWWNMGSTWGEHPDHRDGTVPMPPALKQRQPLAEKSRSENSSSAVARSSPASTAPVASKKITAPTTKAVSATLTDDDLNTKSPAPTTSGSYDDIVAGILDEHRPKPAQVAPVQLAATESEPVGADLPAVEEPKVAKPKVVAKPVAAKKLTEPSFSDRPTVKKPPAPRRQVISVAPATSSDAPTLPEMPDIQYPVTQASAFENVATPREETPATDDKTSRLPPDGTSTITTRMTPKENDSSNAVRPAVHEEPTKNEIPVVQPTKHETASIPAPLPSSPSNNSASPAEKSPPAYQAGDWLKDRDRVIAHLEEEIRLVKADPARRSELTQLETLLRVHCAMAGRRDEAAKPIDGLNAAEREFWKHELFGLVDLLANDRLASESRRYSVALQSLEEARTQLAAAGTLALKNMAFCRKVDDFGRIESFDRLDFKRNQEVLLYVEVRNFAAQPAKGNQFETELQGSFRVLDRGGVARAERTLPLDKQMCANQRHDYYIAYRIYIPAELAPGAYSLELTIEDKKGNKSSNSLVDFNVVP